mgnify:CR=1 FL=1
MLLEEYINVINAIRSYVNGEEMDQAFCSNLAGAYQICKKHNLTALMAEVLDRMDVDKRSPIYQRWQMEKNQAVYKNVLMDVEREEIIAFFEEKNIWYLLLKGLIIREYYPNPALREMSDNDILVDRKYMKDIYDFMVGRGYSIKGYGTSNHDEYLKNIEEYDEIHDTNYLETLHQYLLCNGSIQHVASNMFCHRNTITYRMRVIEDHWDLKLDDTVERFHLMTAFFIRDYLNL